MMRLNPYLTVSRHGMTLLEVMAALIIAATVAAISIQYLRPVDATSKQRTCDMTRELLQNDAQRYFEATGQLPRTDLRELRTAQYSGTVLPICPVTGQSYRRDRNGVVGCPTHEATRAK
jgi:prepilin-type N-terminal cleavage/methylation domain-containing protein